MASTTQDEETKSLPSTRAEAIAVGATRFYPDQPCAHGHTSPRLASTNNCCECMRKYNGSARQRAAIKYKAALAIKRAALSTELAYGPHEARSREQALAVGYSLYFTGKPCRRGHVATRNAMNMTCTACSAECDRVRHENNPSARREYRKATRERSAALRKAWVKSNPLRIKQAQKRRYWKNREENLAKKFIEYRIDIEASRLKKRIISHRHRVANKEKVYASLKQAAIRRRSIPGMFTTQDIKRITELQRNRCACCKRKRKLTIDHIISVAKGGTNHPSNIQMLCQSCNSSKSSKDSISFMQTQGFLL